MTKSERWILSEWRVARDRVERHGETLLAHRLQTPYSEVDLLLRSSPGAEHAFTVIEVKSWVGDIWGPHLVSRRQLRRLERACLHLQETSGSLISARLAVVVDEPTKLGLGKTSGQNLVQIHYYELPPSY